MAHQLLYEFVRELDERLVLPEPIVEFGSMQVEPGQPNDLRPLFGGRDFVGTDFREGPGVDRIEDLRALRYGDGEVGTALCLDTLEHCEDPIAACREMHRVLAPGGLCVITSVMLVGIHAHPNDYWRFTPDGFRVLLRDFRDATVAAVGDPEIPFFVFGVGAKDADVGLDLSTLEPLSRAQAEFERAEGKVRIGPFRLSLRDLANEVKPDLRRVLGERVRARLHREAGPPPTS